MYTRFVTIAAFLLAIANVVLLFRTSNSASTQVEQDGSVDSSYLMYDQGVGMDARGAYTYPGFGWCFGAVDDDSFPMRTPLTLAVFLSAQSSCPLRNSEVVLYKRLVPIFKERRQRVIAVANRADSTVIADSLKSWGLNIPLYLRESAAPLTASLTFEQIGIASANMPFKVLFDSTQTAIYIRGSNNTPQSQADFERAVLRLSDLIHRGQL
ncbi:MAG: hypothetical protein WBP29_09410 [Candidatus Zixiibacteriota bacterium]